VRGWGTVALPRGGRPAPSRRQELRTRRRGDAAAPAPAGHPRRLPGGALCSSLTAPQPGRVSPRRRTPTGTPTTTGASWGEGRRGRQQ
jgi:hypothetical protein